MVRDRFRLLVRLQRALEGLYRVESPAGVHDYVISDEQRVALGAARAPREQLFLVHDPAEQTLDVGLFVDEETLARLGDRDPLDDGCLADFLLAAEGVSHFLYVMLRAQADRPFSALELELQAEVDKYLLVLLGLWREGEPPPRDVCERLFRNVRFHDDLDGEERDRYRTANQAAAGYAASLESRFVRRRAVDDMLREVRRFYRMGCAAKLDHITRKAA